MMSGVEHLTFLLPIFLLPCTDSAGACAALTELHLMVEDSEEQPLTHGCSCS